jgi:hypothetical protein
VKTSPDTARTETKRKSLPVSPILAPPVPLAPFTPSLESAASEFSYLEHYYPALESELVYNNIAALTGSGPAPSSFNTQFTGPPSPSRLVRDPFNFALEPRLAPSRTSPPRHGTIGSVKARAFDPWDRPILFDLDGETSPHTASSPPYSAPLAQSPGTRESPEPWSEHSPSLFTALPPLFAAPSQHSFFSSPTFPRVSKSSEDVTPPRHDTSPLSSSASALTAYNPFNAGSLFAMTESPLTPFAPYPHTSSFGSFNLQNLSQLQATEPDPDHDSPSQ